MPTVDEKKYETIPGLGGVYLKLLSKRGTSLSRKPAGLTARAVVEAAHVDPARLHRYREACGFSDDGTLPILYPHVLTSSLQLGLLGHPQFPLKAAGGVHLRNHILQHRPIAQTETLQVRCSLDFDAIRVVKQGAEVDIETVIESAGTRVWYSVSTNLFRGKFGAPQDDAATMVLGELGEAGIEEQWRVPLDMGKRYASITGDYNPIHINKYTAKLFGFKRDIIHGMWSLAKCLNALPALEASVPQQVDVMFKGPVFMGSSVKMLAAAQASERRFDLYCGDNPRPVLVGAWKA